MLLAKMIWFLKILFPPAPKTICNTTGKIVSRITWNRGIVQGKALLPVELRKK